MAEVLVEHDYIAKEPNELTITKGEIIKNVIKKQDGWWEGTLRDKKGLFPDNFVKPIDKNPTVVLRNRKDASRIRKCRVVFSYKQDHEDELNLNVGDIIDILGEEEEGWWRGFLNGKEGVFPSNFVEEIAPVAAPKVNTSKENLANNAGGHEAAPPLFAKPTKALCEVRFAYKAQNEDELTLKEGDILTLLSKDGQDPGWWKGELNGLIGVFPDNFVTLLPPTDDLQPHPKDEKRPRTHMDQVSSVKPSAVVNAQRKSLETPNSERTDTESAGIKTTPPLPGKKPTVPLKKSPSNSGASGGILFGLKKKLVDAVDGATGSKISPPKTETSENAAPDNVFDDVHRRPLLADVRASRPKAPGRRPPSIVGREVEPGLMNGNTDHAMETVTEASNPLNSSTESDQAESKPKLPEWVKHPAPWLEEMKLNQAKRSSVLPSQEKQAKAPPPAAEKSDVEEKSKVSKKEASPIEKPKSIITSRVKTPTNEFPAVRNKPNVPTPSRPQTIQNVANLTEAYPQKQPSSVTKISPISNKTPSPLQKGEIVDSSAAAGDNETVPNKNHHLELLERRIARLEETIERQQQIHETAIDELRGRLQLETEMRMKLQAKFERFTLEGAIQQL